MILKWEWVSNMFFLHLVFTLCVSNVVMNENEIIFCYQIGRKLWITKKEVMPNMRCLFPRTRSSTIIATNEDNEIMLSLKKKKKRNLFNLAVKISWPGHWLMTNIFLIFNFIFLILHTYKPHTHIQPHNAHKI